jgi:hypothetical protein
MMDEVQKKPVILNTVMCFMKAVGLNKIGLCCISIFYVNNSFRNIHRIIFGSYCIHWYIHYLPSPNPLIIKICPVFSGMKLGSQEHLDHNALFLCKESIEVTETVSKWKCPDRN